MDINNMIAQAALDNQSQQPKACARVVPLVAQFGIVLLLALITPAANADYPLTDTFAQGWADVLHREHAERGQWPRLSDYLFPFSTRLAYQIQHRYIRASLADGAIAGFKVGLVTPAELKRYARSDFATAVLPSGGERSDRAILRLNNQQQRRASLYLAYEIRSAIERPMQSLADLRTYVRCAVPVIELPRGQFEDGDEPRAVDWIAVNLAADQWIRGQRLTSLPTAATRISLFKDDAVQFAEPMAGDGRDPMLKLLALVEQLQADGFTLAPGALLLAVQMTSPLTIDAGRYHVNVDGHTQLRFRAVNGDDQASNAR